MLENRLTVAQMVAEVLRELGVLIAAFGPLDYLFAERTSLTTTIVGAIVLVGFVLVVAGMATERMRR